MGGFFAPDPPSPPPPPPVVTADPEIEAAKARQDSIDRNRRGLRGAIATSETGVLEPAATGGKTLLGD